MLDAMATALAEIFRWPTVLFPMMGTLLGMLFGALPGLGGTTVLALLIPITYAMGSGDAMLLLAASMGGVAFGGSISAILINTPGTAANAATCFDGYPLARQGKAGVALGASATASALGAIFGLIVLVAILPVGRKIILAFSYPEFFMLAILGLSAIAVMSQGKFLKGIISGGLGVMLSFIGYNIVTGVPRFIFGLNYLWDGVKLIPVIIGVFAISEAIKLYIEGESISRQPEINTRGMRKDVLQGVKAVFENSGVFLRSSLIGTVVGIVPGVGGVVANFLAYMQAMQTTKNPENFGKGDIRGVIASEASNDAKDGGALVPTIIFGFPGSAEMAVLLGGLILHGINPGPQMLSENMDIVFILIFGLLISNILTSAVGVVIAPYLINITKVQSKIIAPIIFILCVIGSYSIYGSTWDALVTIMFGLIGYWFKKFNFSGVSLVLGLILGKMAEQNFYLTLMTKGYGGFITRPISLVLLILTLVVVAFPFVQGARLGLSKAGESIEK